MGRHLKTAEARIRQLARTLGLTARQKGKSGRWFVLDPTTGFVLTPFASGRTEAATLAWLEAAAREDKTQTT